MSTKRQSATKLSNAKSADSADILDTNEQEKVVDELRLEAQRQTDKARSMFQVLLWTAAVGFAGCFISGFWAPWAMDHEYVFRSLIPYELFQVYYFGSAITFSILAVIVKEPSQKVSKWKFAISISGVVLSFVMWGAIFYKHSVTNPVLYWLPTANFLGLLIVWYIDYDSQCLFSDVERLDASKYEFKKV